MGTQGTDWANNIRSVESRLDDIGPINILSFGPKLGSHPSPPPPTPPLPLSTFRTIRKWWKALPPNKKQLFREWAWQRRWHLTAVGTGLLFFISLFFIIYMEECPVTGRTRLLIFSKESFNELTEHASQMVGFYSQLDV